MNEEAGLAGADFGNAAAVEDIAEKAREDADVGERGERAEAVSYTHLTLPTSDLV